MLLQQRPSARARVRPQCRRPQAVKAAAQAQEAASKAEYRALHLARALREADAKLAAAAKAS